MDQSSEASSSPANSSSSALTLIFSRQPSLVSKASISTMSTCTAPRKRPARLMATMLPLPAVSLPYSFRIPKCRRSSCSAACVEAYLSWKVPFSSKPFIRSHSFVKSAGSNCHGAMQEANLISNPSRLNSSWQLFFTCSPATSLTVYLASALNFSSPIRSSQSAILRMPTKHSPVPSAGIDLAGMMWDTSKVSPEWRTSMRTFSRTELRMLFWTRNSAMKDSSKRKRRELTKSQPQESLNC